jgi:tetratricopeptide (TPR) repeat protein
VAEAEGRQLEGERAFAEALAAYRSASADDKVARFVAMARCHLGLGEGGHAIDFAQRALDEEPGHVHALAICTRGWLLKQRHFEALDSVDELLEIAPTDGIAHYLRGRCLVGLERLVEARASFERACVLRPDLLEAILLRREVDRALGNIREVVGTPVELVIDVPQHLREIGLLLASGETRRAIEVLERPEHEADAAAQLLLAGALEIERRFDEALAIYERVTGFDEMHRHAALVGKASALLELDRCVEALRLLDRLRAERPTDAATIETRARVLARLGRTVEAEEEYRLLAATRT